MDEKQIDIVISVCMNAKVIVISGCFIAHMRLTESPNREY